MVAMNTADSTDSVDENAQHEPQPPWFFAGVTTPLVRQSTEAGKELGCVALTTCNGDESCTATAGWHKGQGRGVSTAT